MAVWDRVCDDLESLGLLYKTDGAAIAMYVEAWRTWERACADMDDEELTIADPSGKVVPNPLLGIRDRAASQVRGLGDRLGLVATARTRIRATQPEIENDPLKLLMQKKANA